MKVSLEFRGGTLGSEEQADELNNRVKVKVQPSPVRGVGLFALRDISKGQKLYATSLPVFYNLPYSHFSKLFPEVQQFLLERFPRVVEGEIFAYPDSFLQSFMNHNSNPNYDNETDTALRDIKAGEEIFEDYRTIPG